MKQPRRISEDRIWEFESRQLIFFLTHRSVFRETLQNSESLHLGSNKKNEQTKKHTKALGIQRKQENVNHVQE